MSREKSRNRRLIPLAGTPSATISATQARTSRGVMVASARSPKRGSR